MQRFLSVFVSPPILAACALGLLLALLHVLGDLPVKLAFSREAIAGGQWWRFFTGHFVHFTLHHALMNAAGLILVCIALLYRQRLILLGAINVFLPLWISAGLWWQFDGIGQYRGYSGVIYGLISAGLICEWSSNKALYSLAIILLCGKIAYEQLPGYDVNYLMQEIGVPVAIEAHFLGFTGGVAFGLLVLAVRYSRRP